MSFLGLQHFTFSYTFPAKEEPIWKNQVDRWYQLDAEAYGLAQFYSVMKGDLGPEPGLLFLASPSASNETDAQFAHGITENKTASPAKFVHTLPNIRCLPLCQVMDWTGTVLCIQNYPSTRVSALIEAAWMNRNPGDPIWILSVEKNNSAEGSHSVEAFLIKKENPLSPFLLKKNLQSEQASSLPQKANDLAMLEWLTDPTSKENDFALSSDWTIHRKDFS